MNKSADVDWGTVSRLMAGGALAGAGTASVTSLVRYLQDLQRRAQQSRRPDTAWDDDVVYVNLPPKRLGKQAADNSNTAATFAVGGLGALLGALLSHNLVRDQYHKMRKRQLQGEIDQAQQIYLDRLGPTKLAAGQFSTLTKGVGTGWLLALLTTLGSAVVANRVLSSKFPALKSPNRDKPRKVVIRQAPAVGGPAEETVERIDGTPEATESLLRNHLANKTASSASGFADLVAAASQGRCQEIREMLPVVGLDGLFALVKGAALVPSPLAFRDMAVTWVAAQPMLSEAVRPLLAAEFRAAHPGECDVAMKMAAHAQTQAPDASLIGEQLEVLAQLSVETNRQLRGERWAPGLCKGASPLDPMLLSMLPGPLDSISVADELAKLMQPDEQQDGSIEHPTATLTSSTSRESRPITQHKKGLDFEMDSPAAKDFAVRNGDAIDGVLRKLN